MACVCFAGGLGPLRARGQLVPGVQLQQLVRCCLLVCGAVRVFGCLRGVRCLSSALPVCVVCEVFILSRHPSTSRQTHASYAPGGCLVWPLGVGRRFTKGGTVGLSVARWRGVPCACVHTPPPRDNRVPCALPAVAFCWPLGLGWRSLGLVWRGVEGVEGMREHPPLRDRHRPRVGSVSCGFMKGV